MNLSLLCFGSFPVAKKFMDKGGGFQYFQSDFFCLAEPKKFVREPSCAMFQKTNGNEEDYEEVVRVKILPGKLTVSQCRKIS